MLYAARAALSEADQSTRTHRGTWHLFHERHVSGGGFDRSLFAEAQRAQEVRELGDYSAKLPSADSARELIALAERFVKAVEHMLGGR
jgi:uncharacterized protein (UPF0332 family)